MTASHPLRVFLVVPAFLGLAVAGAWPVNCFSGEWRNVRSASVNGLVTNERGFAPDPSPGLPSKGGQLRWLPPDRLMPSRVTPDGAETAEVFPADAVEGRVANRAANSGTGTDGALAVVLEVPVIGNAEPTDDPLADPFGDRQATQPGRIATRIDGQVAQVPPPRPLQTPAELIPPPLPEESRVAGSSAQKSQKTAPPVGQPPVPPTPPGQLLETLPQGPIDQRPMEEQLAEVPGVGKDECPPPDRLRKITEITNNIAPQAGKFPVECPLQGGEFVERNWKPIVFTWTASALCHKPLYFEQVAVERYGHNLGPLVQPFASAAHFFLTVPMLPYKMGLNPPNECIYALGYYRPGSCAPWILDPFPFSVRAALAEGGYWTALAFAIP
ncbi:hypothetical protein [Thermogutta sp.]|uniref:hypothetical protein n=1 Tax=Thermogutta sp. TaxID=1962930 RepID=UPI0032203275